LSDNLLQNKSLIAGIFLISSPTLFALVAYPDTISMSWNEGRGGFLFAMVFLVAELFGIKTGISKKRLLAIIPLAVLVIVYLIALDNGLQDYIRQVGIDIEVPLIHSWIWLWDYILMTVFVVATLFIYFGKKWIRIAPAAPIFLGGSAIILSLDALFPYDTLGPLQSFVPYLVELNVWLVNVFDLGTASARDNLMFLQGDHGSMALQVFWPSAGVHSIIIFSLVMGAFLLKMNIQRNRKTVYFVLGIIGTIGINVIRIFSLSAYALKVTTDAAEWEEFHSVAGTIMFIPWLFIFLLIVMVIESRRLKKKESEKTENTLS
jgi:thaumarchaeosortase